MWRLLFFPVNGTSQVNACGLHVYQKTNHCSSLPLSIQHTHILKQSVYEDKNKDNNYIDNSTRLSSLSDK